MNATLIHFEIREYPAVWVIGREITVEMQKLEKHNPIPDFWHQCMEEKLFEQLQHELGEHIFDPAYAGFIKMLDSDRFTNVCGMLVQPGSPVPSGMVVYNLPAFIAGIGWIQGREPDLFMAAHPLTEEAAQKAGYTYDTAQDFSIELYTEAHYSHEDENGNRILDYCIPVQKSAQLPD